ncbi:MAG: hypothetical protein EBS53_18800 [Bacteroidetes bacterium]|nr:hypothetical protein [Bacteroidota bacterium]
MLGCKFPSFGIWPCGARVFHDYMSKRYSKLAKIMCVDEDPVFSNVKGFHLAGEIMSMPVRA